MFLVVLIEGYGHVIASIMFKSVCQNIDWFKLIQIALQFPFQCFILSNVFEFILNIYSLNNTKKNIIRNIDYVQVTYRTELIWRSLVSRRLGFWGLQPFSWFTSYHWKLYVETATASCLEIWYFSHKISWVTVYQDTCSQRHCPLKQGSLNLNWNYCVL